VCSRLRAATSAAAQSQNTQVEAMVLCPVPAPWCSFECRARRRGSSGVHPGETRGRYRSPHRRVPLLWAYPSWSRRSVAPRRSRVWFGMQLPPEFPPVSGVRDPRPILGAHRADRPPEGWHGGWLRRRTRRTGICPVSPIDLPPKPAPVGISFHQFWISPKSPH
jgi:hypothetical protein